jgi:aspartate carbamoyltransferase catalytic subunit
MTTNRGTMSDISEKAIPQIADSIKATDVADGPFSLILNQAEKGVAAPAAVLYLLAGGE